MAGSHALFPALCAVLLLAACSGSGSTPGNGSTTLSPMAALGKEIFEDQALSKSGVQSCATCHVQAAGFANGDGLPVAFGGPDSSLNLPGLRNTPSLTYTVFTPAFSMADGPVGGFFRDGRASTLTDQAQKPFVNEFEMANADAAAVITKLKTRPYLTDFTAIFGTAVLDDPDTALARMGAALAAYETEDKGFQSFDSKFDAWRAGKAQLTTQEVRGFALFNSPAHGNCAACHPATSADGVTPALFTDFSYDNLGVPRNTALEANNDSTALPYVIALQRADYDGVHKYYDLGVCGPLRSDIGSTYAEAGVCGAFKVPTLRNIALTAPYFHNGIFDDLRTAMSFYVTRDTDPGKWYPKSGNIVTKFDDLPEIYGGQFKVDLSDPAGNPKYVGNVNVTEVPYNRKLGDAPALSADEIDDVIAFLCTLNDGYDPANPSDYIKPQQCLDVQDR